MMDVFSATLPQIPQQGDFQPVCKSAPDQGAGDSGRAPAMLNQYPIILPKKFMGEDCHCQGLQRY